MLKAIMFGNVGWRSDNSKEFAAKLNATNNLVGIYLVTFLVDSQHMCPTRSEWASVIENAQL